MMSRMKSWPVKGELHSTMVTGAQAKIHLRKILQNRPIESLIRILLLFPFSKILSQSRFLSSTKMVPPVCADMRGYISRYRATTYWVRALDALQEMERK